MLKPKQTSDLMVRVKRLLVSAPRLLDEEMTARLLGVEQALLLVLEKDSHVLTWLQEMERRAAESSRTK